MYKTLCAAIILLPTLAFAQDAKTISAPAASTAPQIVAKGTLPNQTAPIATTTIFTPANTGLFRLSAYATISKADPSSNSYWNYSPGWTDDGGTETYGMALFARGNVLDPFQWNQIAPIGATMVFEAKAGTAITYVVTQTGPPDNSAYSLYYTLERLE